MLTITTPRGQPLAHIHTKTMKTKTTSETKPEPAPWILGGISGRMITTPSGYTGDGFIADVDTNANASHIVRCVNAHDALVAALKGFMEYYGAYNDITDKRIEPYAKEAKAALALLP